MQTAEVIRRRRVELGLSQAELAAAVGLDPRQIRRYESGDAEPPLQAARALAQTLAITIDELAGGPPTFSGTWWSCWKGLDDSGTLHAGPMSLSHRGRRVEILPASPDAAAPEEAFAWRSELHADDTDLFGWYIIDDPAARSKGTLIFKLKNGILIGEWVRISLRAGLSAGDIVLAKDRETAQRTVQELPEYRT